MKWAKRIFQLVILALVVWGVWRTFEKAQRDLAFQQSQLQQQLDELERDWRQREQAGDVSAEDRSKYLAQRSLLERQRFRWSLIDPGWLAASSLLYFAATMPGWLFWHMTMHALHQRPRLATSLRAYTIGQLGKYVPGKALVVILRANAVSGHQVDWFVAAAAVFIETLTMIAVGSVLSGLLLIVLFRNAVHPGLVLGACALALVAWLPTIPTFFRRIVAWLQRSAKSHLQDALRGLNRSLIARGWIMMPIAWLLMGLSLWAVAQAAPGATQHELLPSIRDAALHTACIALAVVLGFASFIPGGFGVRELVVTTVLAPTYGTIRALVMAILLRLVWLVTELVLSGILMVLGRFETRHPAQKL